MAKNIIVSNRLPIQLTKLDNSFEFTPTSGGLATGMNSVHKGQESLWVGWPGINNDEIDKKTWAPLKKSLKKDGYFPVSLNQKEIEDFYYGLSNKSLWPLFHYFIEFSVFDEMQWKSYQEVNQKFADSVLLNIEKGDTVWIHDYQLLLCPKMIKDIRPDVTIGFFLHIPFPSFEIFRIFPKREDLLNGILGSDLIGFHTFDYQRHFLSSVKRILNLDVNYNVIYHQGREIEVNTFPMGIDFKKFEKASYDNIQKSGLESSELKKQINVHKLENRGKLILSIDRLDYTKGIINRLLAFERFLDNNIEYHDKVRLVMLAVPSRSEVSQYKILKRQTDEVVGRINGKFATVNWTPVWYYYRSMDFENLIDLYVSSDIAMITPLRDGMNLVAKEYLATRVNNDGVLILSELAGASKEIPQALVVNPFDIEELAESIKTAIEMPLKEQKERNIISRNRIERYDIEKWSSSFMKSLKDHAFNLGTSKVKLINSKIAKQIETSYRNSNKKLLFLDYDGTLINFHKNPEKAIPSIEVLKLIEKLKSNSNTDVVIISGRSHLFMDKYFSSLNIILIAEHGLFIKNKEDSWKKKKGLTIEWKEHLLPILNTFTDNTPGTFIEHKTNSVVWHYRKADPELGKTRSIELKTVLQSLLPNGLSLLDGNKIIELVSSDVNKGVAALDISNKKKYDFILAAGDDVPDENMFTSLPENSYTIKIGKKKTSANYFLRKTEDLIKLLSLLE